MKGPDTGMILAVIATFIIAAVLFSNQQAPVVVQSGGGGNQPAAASSCAFANADTRLGAYNPLNTSRTYVSSYLVKNDDTNQIGETSISGLAQLSATGPNSFSGYVVVGDDEAIGTNRAGNVDAYFTKYPVSWNCQGAVTYDLIPTYGVGYLSNTTYDDGTFEATPSVAVGSGETIDTTEVRFQINETGRVFGNPQVDHPVGVCFNTTIPSDWDYVRPLNYASTFPVPKMFQGRNFIGECYVLPTQAIQDAPGVQNFLRFGLRLKAASGVNPTGDVRVVMMDKSYYLDDTQKWQIGWEDYSATLASVDIGSKQLEPTEAVYMTGNSQVIDVS